MYTKDPGGNGGKKMLDPGGGSGSAIFKDPGNGGGIY